MPYFFTFFSDYAIMREGIYKEVYCNVGDGDI